MNSDSIESLFEGSNRKKINRISIKSFCFGTYILQMIIFLFGCYSTRPCLLLIDTVPKDEIKANLPNIDLWELSKK